MQSISGNAFEVINFLIRNFTKRYTIRNIANELKISPAGVHLILKKLEKNNILVSEKLGTGLFYNINFENKVAVYLCSIVLMQYFDIKEPDFSREDVKAAIFDGKNLLLISDEETIARVPDKIRAVVMSENSFIENIKAKDKAVLELIKNGKVLFGEEIIVNSIKKKIA